ncbi:hypothetical protein [Neorhizobium alkalisoli]|uniref:Uncharacterized protein n=1 Tax=Neorhizobium alkalisoli TaxID=528178 RepID=A0A561R3X2_9HYPH|nr:hypothetical protein [Neorhizobium alkalisoli]TWF57336.1 hypothetical protein FHW37_102979 [Neorhizobium alkalisoli]
MILEALQYAATAPVTPSAFCPYIRSSVSLWSRANRCARAWAEHEDNCQSFIRDRVEGMKQRRTCVVLGSGLLRDVPAGYLSQQFDTVVLVDLVHLASVRLSLGVRGMRNMRFIWRDLSGYDDAVAGKATEPLGFLRQVPYLDLVISANILSQIGIAAKHRLEAEGNARQDEILQALVRAHLDGLAALPCKTALLTDVSYKVADRDGKVTEEADLLCGVKAPAAQRRWTWTVAPYGELGPNHQAVHEVIAI